MYKVIGSDQKIYGPVPAAQIRQWQAEGRVNSATLLQAEGSNEWRALSSTPEFGVPPVVMMPPPAAAQRGNGLALAGLICGVLSNVCCCLGILFAILGILFSVIAISQHEAHPQPGGKTMAVWGLILSAVGLTWQGILPWFFGGLPPGRWMWVHRHWRHW
jgi:hypothetical protein